MPKRACCMWLRSPARAFGAVVKDPERSSMDYVASSGGAGGQGGGAGGQGGGAGGAARQAANEAPPKPSVPQGCGMNGPQGLPLVKPPWGRITALDLNTGNLAWMVPNGETPDCVKNHPLLNGVSI